jgi:internalin A
MQGRKRLKNLTTLALNETRITEAGLKEIAELKRLTLLNIHGTRITGAGMKQLQQSLPNLNIIQ